mgnify:CR=1 FL=1
MKGRVGIIHPTGKVSSYPFHPPIVGLVRLIAYTAAELSLFNDTPKIPLRYQDVIVARVKYYVHILRGNDQAAQFAFRDYENGIRRMKTELLNQKDYMRAV